MMAAAMLAVGCQKEDMGGANPATSEATFNIAIDNSMATRSDDGSTLNFIIEIYEVSENGGAITDSTPDYRITTQETSFSVALKENAYYVFLYWADYDTADQDEYNTESLRAVALNGVPTKEAFSLYDSFQFLPATKSTFIKSIPHSVAQVNYKQAADLDFTADNNTLKVTYSKSYTYDVYGVGLTEILTDGASTPITYTFENIAKESAGSTIGTNYVFGENETNTVLDVKCQFNDETERTLTNVPFRRYFITNISGSYSNLYDLALTASCVDEWNTESADKTIE